ncbi:hypothetical protein MMC18_002962 [Xylographa bjoerkii]|nr:hypothetical protein [Xylographa bjoerkii]
MSSHSQSYQPPHADYIVPIASTSTSASFQPSNGPANPNPPSHTSALEGKPSHLELVRTALGLHPHPPVADHHLQQDHHQLLWSQTRLALREFFAEFFGTFIMVMFGNGSVAQVLLSSGETSAPGGNGYLNPAITFTNCLFRQLPWRRFPIFCFAQFLGGFCAAGVVYANYISAINNIEGDGIRTVPPSKTATAGIFCTYPQQFLPRASMFFSEFIASTLLMFVIFALKDDSNLGAGKLFPLMLFFLIFGLGACFGFETGYALNLARDFGPRLMSYAVGYGGEVWSAGGYYFWVSGWDGGDRS